jgi:hypothetical protein
MLVQINVTEKDIDLGVGCNVHSCMVALALQRITENCALNVTHKAVVFYRNNGKPLRVTLNDEVGAKIRAFDFYYEGFGIRPQPFSFELDVPIEFLKLEVPTKEVVAC